LSGSFVAFRLGTMSDSDGSFGADPIVDLVGRKQSANSSRAEADLHN
jgi:hypothetical protein